MESDSDSGGSYISATPPRKSKPQPPAAPTSLSSPPPPPPPPLLSSRKSRSSVKSSKPRKPSANPTKPPSNLTPDDPPPPVISHFSTLPFQIRNSVLPASDSVHCLPAGHLSNCSSFSKIRRTSLNFEPVEDFRPPISAETHSSAADRVLPENKSASVKKHPNLISSNAPLPNVKLRKTQGSEGNFVKLNLNRKFRKFTNRKGFKRNSYAAGNGRRFTRRSKRKLKNEGEAETEGVCDEDGLVTEITQEKQKRGSESIEKAVLAARDEASDDNLLKLLKVVYGHDSFRDGQLEAIKMVLAGESTMLVLPTGAGKSLCYQIPALLLHGITLVVSPLVALMIDQLKQLPHAISGGLICSNQTPQEAAEILGRIREGTLKVLFVSPERFLNADFLSVFSDTNVSLLVVDEAHCISEWSQNFRPAYMRLRASLLRTKLNIGCILAMSATVTATTLNGIMSALEIPSTNLVQKSLLRDNLQLSVSLSGNRLKDLLMLIKSNPYKEVQSIIIYCKFQFESDSISRYFCDNNISAKSYHSAIPAKDRCRIQELFCSNKIRVVVATVAFGMGLDKRDVGAVIHYILPESLEEYVQEIGRAGRDGRSSYCHLFFDDLTYFKLRSLMHSDGVDEYVVNKFLCQVFTNKLKSCGKLCSIIKESSSHKFDMKEEVILTLLTQLELGDVQYLRLLPQINATCSLHFHKSSPMLLADKDILVSAILKNSEAKQGQYLFDIPTVANSIGVSTVDISNHLQNLKLKGEITYEVKDPAFCYSIMQVPGDFCSLSAHLTKWLSEVECCKVRKLDTMFNAAVFAVNKCNKMLGCHDAQHTPCLQLKILNYFKEDDRHDIPNKIGQSSPFLRADIKGKVYADRFPSDYGSSKGRAYESCWEGCPLNSSSSSESGHDMHISEGQQKWQTDALLFLIMRRRCSIVSMSSFTKNTRNPRFVWRLADNFVHQTFKEINCGRFGNVPAFLRRMPYILVSHTGKAPVRS